MGAPRPDPRPAHIGGSGLCRPVGPVRRPKAHAGRIRDRTRAGYPPSAVQRLMRTTSGRCPSQPAPARPAPPVWPGWVRRPSTGTLSTGGSAALLSLASKAARTSRPSPAPECCLDLIVVNGRPEPPIWCSSAPLCRHAHARNSTSGARGYSRGRLTRNEGSSLQYVSPTPVRAHGGCLRHPDHIGGSGLWHHPALRRRRPWGETGLCGREPQLLELWPTSNFGIHPTTLLYLSSQLIKKSFATGQ
jgi:hypothetical protein